VIVTKMSSPNIPARIRVRTYRRSMVAGYFGAFAPPP